MADETTNCNLSSVLNIAAARAKAKHAVTSLKSLSSLALSCMALPTVLLIVSILVHLLPNLRSRQQTCTHSQIHKLNAYVADISKGCASVYRTNVVVDINSVGAKDRLREGRRKRISNSKSEGWDSSKLTTRKLTNVKVSERSCIQVSALMSVCCFLITAVSPFFAFPSV